MTNDRNPFEESTEDPGPTGSDPGAGAPASGTGDGSPGYGEPAFGGAVPPQQPYGLPYPGAQGYPGQPGQYGAPYPDHSQPGGAGSGYTPPGYGPTGYPQAPMPGPNSMGAAPFSATGAIGSAWQLFAANWAPWVIITLLLLVVSGGLNVGTTLLMDPYSSDVDPASVLGVSFGSTLLVWIFSLVLSAFMLRGALLEVDGRRPALGDFFTLTNFWQYLLVSVLVTVFVFLGLFALIVGAIVAQFFLYWAGLFTLDRDQDAMEAIKSSFATIKANATELFLLAILNTGLSIAGVMLCGVGVLVTTPLTLLASVYAYRMLTGPSGYADRELPVRIY